MISPTVPDDELARLEDLKNLGLSRASSDRLDRITSLARDVFGLPISLISIVDEDEQWFKSCQGLDVPSTSREVSFCAHAINYQEVFVVEDALNDPRFHDNPLVIDAPGIRFYAGAQLRMTSGRAMGTLCVIDQEPRNWTSSQSRALRSLADLVESELEAHRLESAAKVASKVTSAQLTFIQAEDRGAAFERLLTDILELTGCEFGFIGEVLHTAEGSPYLKTRALTNIAWNEDTRALYERNAASGMEFTRLDTLFGVTLRTGQPVISNDPYSDSRRGGLPAGHPVMESYMGIPIHRDGSLLAMLGLANMPGGFSMTVLEYLEPLLVTIGQLIEASLVRAERDLANTEIRRLSSVVSQMPNGVLITDTSGYVQWVNDAFTNLTGYPREEIVGQRPRNVMHGPGTDAAVHSGIVEAMRQGQPFNAELLAYTKSGDPLWVSLHSHPLQLPDGTDDGFLVMVADISERRRVEQMKAQFVSTVSHELRTPLTAVTMALSLVMDGAAGPTSEQAQDLLGIAHTNAERLTTLINDLLDMDKLVAGGLPMEREPQPLLPVVMRAVEENQAYAHRFRTSILYEGPLTDEQVDIDSLRLIQVLSNLLSNACKFSPPDSVVRVSAQASQGSALISVTDQGSGIAPDFAEHIFEKFSQADSSDQRLRGGTGLGLAIAKELTEAQGGSLTFKSSPEGTTFTVTLPLLSSEESEAC